MYFLVAFDLTISIGQRSLPVWSWCLILVIGLSRRRNHSNPFFSPFFPLHLHSNTLIFLLVFRGSPRAISLHSTFRTPRVPGTTNMIQLTSRWHWAILASFAVIALVTLLQYHSPIREGSPISVLSNAVRSPLKTTLLRITQQHPPGRK